MDTVCLEIRFLEELYLTTGTTSDKVGNPEKQPGVVSKNDCSDFKIKRPHSYSNVLHHISWGRCVPKDY